MVTYSRPLFDMRFLYIFRVSVPLELKHFLFKKHHVGNFSSINRIFTRVFAFIEFLEKLHISFHFQTRNSCKTYRAAVAIFEGLCLKLMWNFIVSFTVLWWY